MTEFNPVTEDLSDDNLNYPQKIEPVIIKSENQKLLGTFFRAAGKEKKPLAIILHGFPGNENNFDIAHAVSRSGRNAVVFHYRGSWGSGGEFSFLNSLNDLYTVIEFFGNEKTAEQFGIERNEIVLIGHSMGGMLALLASIKYEQIKKIAFLAGFNFGGFAEYLLAHPEFIEETTKGLVMGSEFLNGANPKTLFKEMLRYKNDWNLLKRANELKDKNIFLVAAEYDTVAPPELHHNPLVAVFTELGISFKSIILTSGHSFTSKRIALTTEIIKWIEKKR